MPICKPKNFAHLDESADHDENIEPPEPGSAVPSDMRALLEHVEPWTRAPDYERTRMINRLLKVLWPTLTEAVMKEVLAKVKPVLQEKVFAKYGFVEDIVLGTEGMKEGGMDYSAWVKDKKKFSPGTIPPKIGGFKVYSTGDDEVIAEVPLIWGSDMHFSVGVFLKAGPVRLYVPVDVSNLLIKAEARITLKPLVDVIPCIGGVTISLLSIPQVDLSLCIFKGVDLMALPIVKDVVRMALKMVTETICVLPNSISVPLLPNWGLPLPPKGALNVKLLRCERVKGGLSSVRVSSPNHQRRIQFYDVSGIKSSILWLTISRARASISESLTKTLGYQRTQSCPLVSWHSARWMVQVSWRMGTLSTRMLWPSLSRCQ